MLVPLAAPAPDSFAYTRSALIACVCCFASNSRMDKIVALACVSADFTGTKVMPGRNAPSQIASASMWSFLPRLTNGLAYCGGINRTRCPSPPRTRPQWCDPPHASSTTSVGGSLRKNVSTCPRRSSRRSTTSPRSWFLTTQHLALNAVGPSTPTATSAEAGPRPGACQGAFAKQLAAVGRGRARLPGARRGLVGNCPSDRPAQPLAFLM